MKRYIKIEATLSGESPKIPPEEQDLNDLADAIADMLSLPDVTDAEVRVIATWEA